MKFFKKLLIGASVAGSLLFAESLYRIHKFEVSCDINEDPLDKVSVFKNEDITFRRREMKDFKAGAFYGNLTLNLKNLIITDRVYDIYLECICGSVTLILPENASAMITGTNSVDNQLRVSSDAKSLFSITAKTNFGKVILKNERT